MHHCPRRVPPVWLACLTKTSLFGLAPHGFSAPASWFYPPRGFRAAGTRSFERRWPSSDLAPLRSFTRDPWRPPPAQAHALPWGFLAPTAQPMHWEPPSLGFAYPSHVASSHLPCVSTPYSLNALPGVFSTRRALGAPPFGASPDRDRNRLSAGASPLAISEPTAVGRR